MNWQAIGAVAELLAAVGVIASLVYLTAQIRHSREQMSQNTKAIEAQVTWAHWNVAAREASDLRVAPPTPRGDTRKTPQPPVPAREGSANCGSF